MNRYSFKDVITSKRDALINEIQDDDDDGDEEEEEEEEKRRSGRGIELIFEF